MRSSCRPPPQPRFLWSCRLQHSEQLTALQSEYQEFKEGVVQDRSAAVAQARDTELQLRSIEELVKEGHDASKALEKKAEQLNTRTDRIEAKAILAEDDLKEISSKIIFFMLHSLLRYSSLCGAFRNFIR